MKLIIALGGNAILKKGERSDMKTQERNVKLALKSILHLVKKSNVVLVHGSGPQVGYLMLKQGSTSLEILDAQVEGQIGYLIQQNLYNLMKKKDVVTLITQVLVDGKDSAFKNPSKFIGPYYKNKISGFTMKKDPRGGYRRVVASPRPIKIIEARVIKNLLEKGVIVIAAGGGGIPVISRAGKLDGVEAVIDKDLASACLGVSVKADVLVMITDVSNAYLNFKKSGQKALGEVKLKDIKKYYAEGHFLAGSMGPKIQAAINFLEGGGKKAIITNTALFSKAMKEKGGTIIFR